MRFIQMITVGVAGIALTTDALAACESGFVPAGTAPNLYCIPTAGLPVGATVTIANGAVLGQSSGPSVHISNTVNIGLQATVGTFTRLGELGPVTIAPKAKINDSISYALGTRIKRGVIGRRDIIGDQDTIGNTDATGAAFSAAADILIGRNVTIGDRVIIGFGAVINDNAIIGNDVTLGNLSSVGFGAEIGNNTDVGRGTIIGNYAEVQNVELGPDINIGAYATVGEPTGAKARIRSGADVGKYADINAGTRVGRDAQIGDYSTIEANSTVRAGGQVAAGGTVESGMFIPRCSGNPPADTDRVLVASNPPLQTTVSQVCPATFGSNSAALSVGTSTAVTGGFSCHYPGAADRQNECLVPGNNANIPKEPSGTFFSAAGGKVCVEKPLLSTDPGYNGGNGPDNLPSTGDEVWTPGACHFLGMEDDLLTLTNTQAGMGFARNLGPVACTSSNKATYTGEVISGPTVCTDNNPSTGCCVQPDRYCLDDNQDSTCDTHVGAGQPAQAILITAPDTIGVSPYSYNNGSTPCPSGVETGTAPNITCTVTVSGGGYTLQAGPIYVLSPPTP